MNDSATAVTASKWEERVQDWRASGASAESYSSGQAFAASTLRWWAGKLRRAAASPVTMARVTRTRTTKTGSDATVGTGPLVVELGNVHIVVRRGFDAELLQQVVKALGVAR